MDDPALVEALRSGDPQAPRLLVERFQGVVFGLCYRMMNHQQDAEDVAQETFVRALRSMARFDARRPIRPWLLGIAANRCRTALARRSRRPTLAPAESVADRADPRAAVADPDDLAGELERASLAFGPSIVSCSSSSTNRILCTRRLPRSFLARWVRSRPGSIEPGPNWPRTSAAGELRVETCPWSVVGR